MWRKIFDVFFWLAVAAYFGGMLALGAIAAPAIFSTAHDARLTMPGIAAPPLDLGNQVGGEVFGVILNRFAYLEYAATGLILVALAGWFRLQKPVAYSTWVIALLWVGLAGIVAYDSTSVRPEVFQQREAVRRAATAVAAAATLPETIAPGTGPTPATTPATAGPADAPLKSEQAKFDALHGESEDLGRYKAYILLGMIVVGAVYGFSRKSADLPEAPVEEEPPPRRRPGPAPAPPKPIRKKSREVIDP